MSDEATEQTAEQPAERKPNDQSGSASAAKWTPPWEGNINKPHPVPRYQPAES